MKVHHFFVAPQSLHGRNIAINDPLIVKQIAKVLHLAPGEEVMLLDGDGFEYVTRLVSVSAKTVSGEILKRQQNITEPNLKITLHQALLKKDNIEWAFQKCTEVGVHAFNPVMTARSEKQSFKTDRAIKIIREAAEQSGRGIIPELAVPQLFEAALRRATRSDVPIAVLHSEGEPIGSYYDGKQLFAAHLFVGPEGGWSDEELEFVRNMGKEGRHVTLVSLGTRTLRAETAGVVAAGILLAR